MSNAIPARLGNVVNLDLRYSRFVPIGSDSTRAEVLVEAKNLFNRQNVSA